uniref:histidine kinase n=1 Tax=Nephroselmis pyriformis TaxID=156128 RepID=A0A097CKH4_9CHLO|nr:phytochrome [Nephroselmis pyriformis]
MEDGATRYGLCDDDAKDVELSKLYEQQATIALASSKAKLDEEIKEVVVSKTEPQRSTRDFEAYGRLINRPGLIQAHGCTILLQKKTLKILASSMNSLDHLGVSANVIINATLGEVGFLDADSLQDIQVCMQAADPTLTNPRHVKTVSGKTLHAILHHVKDGTIVDFEPLASESTNTATGVTACFRMIHEAMERIGVIKDLSTLYDGIVKEIQNLSGYDRVMLYQFHEDNHGEVVAECRKDVNIPSYLNLHFPATDIPQVSRRLFMTMKQRMVGDIKASQVGFVQAPELAEENLLLSQSQLRGVTGCHAQYLENIGVRATLVNAVVVGPTHSSAASAFGTKDNSRKLWGLIVCHNLHDKRIVEFHVRSALLFLVDVFALQLQRLMDIMETAQNELMWSAQNELYNNVVTTDDFNIGAVADNPECLMKFVGASGAAVLSGGSLHLIGRTPRAVQLNELADWIRAQPSYDDQRVVCTRSLVADGAPGAASYVQDAAGLLAVGVPQKATSSVPDSMIIWFRSEVVESVTWAGTNEQHVPKRESDYLQPRESFKAYLKTMANTSARWEPRILVSVRSFQEVLSLTQTCDNKMKTLAHMTSRVSVQRSITVSQLTAVSRELNNVIESAPMAVIFVNSSLEITEINEFFKNIIGSAADDCLGRPINRHLTSASYARLTQLIVEVLGCGKHSHAVLEVTGAKHTVSLQFVVSPRRDQQGGVTGAVLVGQLSDVQPDVLASLTEPLAAAEDEFFLSKMATPVFSIGQCGNVCQWNQAMENVTGLPNSSARGRLLVGDIFGCKDRNSLRLEDERSFTAFAAAIMSALEGNRVDGHMLTFSSVSGRIIELLCTASTRKHGTESNVYLFCQDLSLLRSLENATIVRTAAEAVASSNSRTLAFLCHEIRNPLNGIMAVVSFMEHEQHLLHDEHRDLVKSAASSCLQVRRIVDDVLDISKIEEGKLVLDNTAFNVRATAAACVDQVGYAGQEKGLDVIMDVTGMEVSVLLGDSCRIQQVVSNFLWNAVKFTEKGKVELQVQSWVTDAGNARVKFSIVDTGPGMTESMQSKIFKAFEMGAGKMTRWGGTGLGLNISSVLAEMMGGSISCQSAPGEGTTMSFEVPLRVPSVHEIKVLDSKTPLKASTEKGGRTKLVRGRMKAIGQDDQLIDQSHAGRDCERQLLKGAHPVVRRQGRQWSPAQARQRRQRLLLGPGVHRVPRGQAPPGCCKREEEDRRDPVATPLGPGLAHMVCERG